MLTPTSALEANYSDDLREQHSLRHQPITNNYKVNTRTQEISGAYVRSFVFKNFNPFVEAGPAASSSCPSATPAPLRWT